MSRRRRTARVAGRLPSPSVVPGGVVGRQRGGSSLTDATRRREHPANGGRIGAAVNLRYELAIFGAFLAFIAILIAVMYVDILAGPDLRRCPGRRGIWVRRHLDPSKLNRRPARVPSRAAP